MGSVEDRFSITTNFDYILKDALARIVAQYIRKAQDELEKALRVKSNSTSTGNF